VSQTAAVELAEDTQARKIGFVFWHRRVPWEIADPALDVLDGMPGRALVPAPIEGLGGYPELDDEVIRVVWRLRLTALISATT
jgi:hypothetical protein